MSETLYPNGYGNTLVTMEKMRSLHEPKMHPEFARRLFAWIESQKGHIGIGGGWRATGSQPDKPGFAPEGKSFHQSQSFPSGSFYAAVDLVARNGSSIHRSPNWNEVPKQGSTDAAFWGVHCNVSSEAWHMQPIELDGWQGWVNAGRPDIEYGYNSGKELEMKITNPPVRSYDSRQTGGKHTAGETRKVNVTKSSAAFVNITVAQPEANGYVTVWASGARPNVSHVNFTSNENVCNGVWVPVASDGTVHVYTHGPCHVVLDVLATA